MTNQHPTLVLMYHRIMQPELDPWSLCVSPANFKEHLLVIRQHARVSRLHEVVDARRNAAQPPVPTVVITFDDGYADNVQAALPVLEECDVPATFFISTGILDGQQSFWWDDLADVLLRAGELPATLHLQLDGLDRAWTLGDGARLSESLFQMHRHWMAPLDPPTPRHALFLELWRTLQMLPERTQQGALHALRAWSGARAVTPIVPSAMSSAEVQTLGSSKVADIGAHTVTHASLPALSIVDQQREIAAGKRALEQLLSRSVTAFAYPYGAYSGDTLQIVRDAGFTVACTTEHTSVTRNIDALQVPRFQVHNWDRVHFAAHLVKWLQLA